MEEKDGVVRPRFGAFLPKEADSVVRNRFSEE